MQGGEVVSEILSRGGVEKLLMCTLAAGCELLRIEF